MRTLLPEIRTWRRAGKQVALATVVKVWGSAPRPPGSRMATSDGGDLAGSVSGGCVEGAVFEEAREVLETGRPKLVRFGVTHEEAWAVGLSCGGEIEIFVEALGDEGSAGAIHEEIRRSIEDDVLIVLATVVAARDDRLLGRRILVRTDGTTLGSLGAPNLDAPALAAARQLFSSHGTECRRLSGAEVFLEALAPRRKLVVVGAVHVAVPLVHFARHLDFRTIVVDPRTAFATLERFGHADEICREWPDRALRQIRLNESSYVALLSHDLKLDLPALEVALRSPVRYIGALGSRKTHARRLAALRERGFEEASLERIRNPIGLPLGGRRAEEMAVSILAEIVAVSHGVADRLRT